MFPWRFEACSRERADFEFALIWELIWPVNWTAIEPDLVAADLPLLGWAAVTAAVAVMLLLGGLILRSVGARRRVSRIALCRDDGLDDEEVGPCPHLANAIRVEINRRLPGGRQLPLLDASGQPRRPLRRFGPGQPAPGAPPPGMPPLQSARQKIAEAVAEHLPMLARRRAAMVRVDEQGVVEDEAWQQECLRFAEDLVRPRLTEAEAAAVAAAGPARLLTAMLGDPGHMERAWYVARLSYHHAMPPSAYEAFCAARLREAGWHCERGPPSDGGGADIVARRDGVTLILRCWKTSAGVRPAVVQDAAAARQRLGADAAAVVSNAPFSSAAIALGAATGTLMLNHAELDLVAERIGSRAPVPPTPRLRHPAFALPAGMGASDEPW